MTATSTLTRAEAGRLAEEGARALRSGDAVAARDRLAEAAPAVDDPAVWYNLAVARGASGEPRTALDAVAQALRHQPRNLTALLLKGQLYEQLGDDGGAAAAYNAALAVAPPFERLPADLKTGVRRAHAVAKAHNDRRDAFLREELGRALGGEGPRRLAQSLDVLSGRRSIYRQQPHVFYWPEVPCVEFYDPADFPWLDAVVAQTEAIRDEFLAVHAEDSGFEPYIAYSDDQPLDQWAELNRNPKWSAFHLLKDGRPVEPNASRCPRTMAALAPAPQPEFPGRCPVAMFSLLKPGTRIPPHTGVTNARLVVHIPLLVPENCGFRVGGQTREWRVGTPLVFDDTIEHEAWNESGHPRCVLIFDIWNPHLSADEREAVTALFRAIDAFDGEGREDWS